jgi:PBSX family phage terminase large subunit
MAVNISEIIAPLFYDLHKSIKRNEYTHYWLKGGRGSTKSSFISLEIVLDILKDPLSNAVCLRKYQANLRTSVYEQIYWAIYKLGVQRYFSKPTKNISYIEYLPTGQRILFTGCDDPDKVKSITLAIGYIKNVWFEELVQFSGMEEVRKLNQSFLRGGKNFRVFYSYNPPKSLNSWVNSECRIPKKNRIVHHSTYLEVPVDWLGETFIIEAEHLKKTKPNLYNHEYLGEITGTGGEIFDNVRSKIISDEEIAKFDLIREGIDWGYAISPFAYVKLYYDKTRKDIYLFDEIYRLQFSNDDAVKEVKKKTSGTCPIVADSNEPKSINFFEKNGLWIEGAEKGKGSIIERMKFLTRFVNRIYIDPERCPNSMNEFTNYEHTKLKDGSWKDDYPDKNDHTIDGVGYAMEKYIKDEVGSFDIV